MASSSADDTERPAFVFVTCQVGAERALKAEIARLWPKWHFAYSRPGFTTFKLPSEHQLASDFDLRAVFARAYGFSVQKVTAERFEDRVAAVCQVAGQLPCEALHVWQRDKSAVGFRGFEPHATSEALEAQAAISKQLGAGHAAARPVSQVALAGQLVLDCVLVEPNEWWVGYHQAGAGESRFAGGLREIAMPHNAVSRAYLKMQEALEWSQMPIRPGQRCFEIGCAPGGASQALLDAGLKVTGVDPARVDPLVLAHPKFTHIQKRGADVRRREFRHATWLTSDMNVAPQYTLDTIEAIVTHPAVEIRGLLLTLKLPEWDLAAEIPAFLERIRSWGYAHVRARQLVHNRQEICVTAQRRKPPKAQANRQRSGASA